MLIPELIAGACVVACYMGWRYARLKSAQRRFRSFLPPSRCLSWNESDSTEPLISVPIESSTHTANPEFSSTGDNTSKKRPISDFLVEPKTWAAVADGSWAAVSMAQHYLTIDPYVLHAIEFSTADHLHNLTTIDDYVHDHFGTVPIHSADGWFERLSGYVAEQKAAAYFESMGHHVDFAPVANQPIWDLLVDGHPVQIKEGLAGARDFIGQHPGVDVFAPQDVAASIKDPAVHGLDVLDKDSVQTATHSALEGIHGSVTPEFHFPIITFGLSSWREAKLLWDEKTTLQRALLHVGLDVAGVGTGGFAGLTAGAAIGSIFPGAGTVIGAFVGGIVGGISGKLGATTIRMHAFKSAAEKYMATASEAQSAVDKEIEGCQARVAALQSSCQQRYLAKRVEIEESTKVQIAAVSAAFDDELLKFCGRFPRFLEDLIRQLDREEYKVLAEVPSRGLWGMLFPSDRDLYRLVVSRWFIKTRALVENEIRVFEAIEDRSLLALHAEIQHFLSEYRFEVKTLSDAVAQIQNQYKAAQNKSTEIQNAAIARAEKARTQLIEEFRDRVAKFQESVVKEIDRWNTTLSGKKSLLKTEAAAVGIDL